ncbi:MAG: hypothetical protein JWQ19_1214 [Subtercola sp.]|nr:hypothetical protein [Subtercola sp.]
MAKKAIETVGFDPIKTAHDLGIRSNHAYIAGFASVVIALSAWLISRRNKNHDKAQSDRWGIFVGHWAPTFFAIGIALKNEE